MSQGRALFFIRGEAEAGGDDHTFGVLPADAVGRAAGQGPGNAALGLGQGPEGVGVQMGMDQN